MTHLRPTNALMAGSLARGTFLMLAWQALRAGMQGIWGIALARVLGPHEYGLFAGFAGLASTLGALTGIGFGLLMLQNASRDPDRFANYWNVALAAVGASAVLLAIAYLTFAPALTGQTVSRFFLFAIALPELACLPLIVVCSYAFQAQERMGWAGALYAFAPAGNLLALAFFLIATNERAIEAYLFWHIWISLAVTGFSLTAVYLVLRPRWGRSQLASGDKRSARGFAMMQMADTGLASLDKTLVLRVAGSDIAGQYTAAYRLAALVALPVISLAVSVTPRLFRKYGSALSNQRRTLQKLFSFAAGIGLMTIPLTWGLAFTLPWLLGTKYEPAAAMARQLLLLPALLGLSALGCSILMTSGKQGLRAIIQSGAIVGLLLSMPWLIERHPSNGAVWAVQLVYAALVLAIWWSIRHSSRLSRDPGEPYY